LQRAAQRLDELNEKLVYLGGCATALFINDPNLLDVRPTMDVDCIVNVISLSEYYEFGSQLKRKGFKEFTDNDVICRWHCDGIILDVMPTEEKILGFTNSWFKEALEHAVKHEIADNLLINSLTAPYFLATKMEAFKTRGNKDLLGSSDYEDLITVIAGRTTIPQEVAEASPELKKSLRKDFEYLLRNDQFEPTLPGHINEGPVTMERVQVVKNRIREIMEVCE
jgi:hypothetical protein